MIISKKNLWLSILSIAIGAFSYHFIFPKKGRKMAKSLEIENNFSLEEKTEIEMEFKRAVEHVNKNGKIINEFNEEIRLTIYSLYKQSSFGDNNKNKPASWELIESAKWYFSFSLHVLFLIFLITY